MTCQELRLYFGDPLRRDDELRPELEHLAHCAECARFVEAQRELGNNLRLARESAPAFPATLDAAVLANYRRHIAGQPNPVIAASRKRSFAILRWSAVAAAFAVMAVLLYLATQKKAETIAQPQVSQPVVPAESPTVAKPIPAAQPKVAHAARPKLRHKPASSAVAEVRNPLPPGFHSLMYCDELSCGDLMELIRVQLPPTAFPFGGSNGAQPISADVLVGPDGIARGIRVVE